MRLLTMSTMLIGIVAPMSAWAQQAIDPATVTVPDVNLPKDKAAAQALIDNGWKYFFFHKEGVGFDGAVSDIAFCYRYLPAVAPLGLPAYVTWTKTGAPPPKINGIPPYGLVGALMSETIGKAIASTLQRRDRQSRMRRCMETRGYVRYPMAEQVWEKLAKDDPATAIPILAKLASGPKPDLPVPQK